jgi:hypothetical protein
MKHIKLFEKFSTGELVENNIKANEILDDIKSISYIIEDEEFKIQYTFQFNKNWVQSFIEVNDYNNSRDNGRDRVKINGIHLKISKDMRNPETSKKREMDYLTGQREFSDDFDSSDIKILNNFITLLKEHLDYIDEKYIISTFGNFNNSMSILIKLDRE